MTSGFLNKETLLQPHLIEYDFLSNFLVEYFGYQLLYIDSDALTNSMFLDDQIHGRKKIIACFFTKVRHRAVADHSVCTAICVASTKQQ